MQLDIMYITTSTTNIDQVKEKSVHNTYKCVQIYNI